jgi:prolyl-tRNA editing enzyme YbaK/EbsC (Cys-tRNA(Pro) deacylase)
VELSPAEVRVAAALADAGLVVDVRRFPQGTRTAEEAAAAVGCELGQIVKSLVFTREERPVLVLCGGDGRVDAARLGLRRADADEVRRATGFSIGGVPPLGHTAGRLETLIDEALLGWPVVWAAAGTAMSVFPIAPDDLVRVTGGRVAAVRPPVL